MEAETFEFFSPWGGQTINLGRIGLFQQADDFLYEIVGFKLGVERIISKIL